MKRRVKQRMARNRVERSKPGGGRCYKYLLSYIDLQVLKICRL